jgi:hypothetical protein
MEQIAPMHVPKHAAASNTLAFFVPVPVNCLHSNTQSTAFLFQAFHKNACKMHSLHRSRLTVKPDWTAREQTSNPSPS